MDWSFIKVRWIPWAKSKGKSKDQYREKTIQIQTTALRVNPKVVKNQKRNSYGEMKKKT